MTADILARIDATLDATANGCCACGCRRRLHPGGPSVWFADEACQQRWAAGRVGARPADTPAAVVVPPECAGAVDILTAEILRDAREEALRDLGLATDGSLLRRWKWYEAQRLSARPASATRWLRDIGS